MAFYFNSLLGLAWSGLLDMCQLIGNPGRIAKTGVDTTF